MLTKTLFILPLCMIPHCGILYLTAVHLIQLRSSSLEHPVSPLSISSHRRESSIPIEVLFSSQCWSSHTSNVYPFQYIILLVLLLRISSTVMHLLQHSPSHLITGHLVVVHRFEHKPSHPTVCIFSNIVFLFPPLCISCISFSRALLILTLHISSHCRDCHPTRCSSFAGG